MKPSISALPVGEADSGAQNIGPGSLIEISYRDFPERIVAEDGAVVYESAQ